MFKRVGSTLRPRIRGLHFHSSASVRFGGLNGVTLSVISTAVAGSALWYFTVQNVYNDAAGPLMAIKKQKVNAPGTGTPTDLDTLCSLVWGSNRSVFRQTYCIQI